MKAVLLWKIITQAKHVSQVEKQYHTKKKILKSTKNNYTNTKTSQKDNELSHKHTHTKENFQNAWVIWPHKQ